MEKKSFFKKYYHEEEFIDRVQLRNEASVDVIMPIFNTNPLFEKNLKSIYREIPINRLIIGDGGCTDDSLEILNKFPRVMIIDQTKNRTLGYCIAELISHVKTEWFFYFHADVYLPENWYNTMKNYQNKYDWCESDSRIVTMIEYDPNIKNVKRAYSGSQMGRKKAFTNIISKIDDDFLYRNEDIVFQQLILEDGFKYGRINDTYYYHQVMNKKGEKEPKLRRVSIEKDNDREWEIKTYIMQVKGIIKYSKPRSYLIKAVNKPLRILLQYNAIDIIDFRNWVKNTNESWLKYIVLDDPIAKKIINKLQRTRLFKTFYNRLYKSDKF